MMNFIISLILGMLPEVAYFVLFLTFVKNIKNKRGILFLLLAIGYVLLIMLCQYQYLFYVLYVIYIYFALKTLYKTHVSDIFVITIGFTYLGIISYVFYILIDNYAIYYIVDRILLFVPLILLKNKIRNIYKMYISMWNRSDNNKIKSLTIRNASLLIMNIAIVVTFLILLYIMSIV